MIGLNIKKRFSPKARNRIGLDIDSSSIKMLEISLVDENPSISSIGLVRISSAARMELVSAIGSLAETTKVSGREVNVSVSGPSVIVRFVSMPKMKDEELKSAMRFEAEKYVPFAINDCIVDYQVLGKNEKENKLDILLVAVKKDLVLERVSIVEDSGFSVGLVDVDIFAVTNAYLKSFTQTPPDKIVALLNIGAKFTNVGIVKDSVMCFARDVAIGGHDFDQAIAKGLNIDIQSVEAVKISPVDKLSNILSCTKNIVNSLLDEMRLSFSYYENQSGRSIDEIYLCGGSSGLPGLDILFQEAFESKPHFFNPINFLDKTKEGLDTGLIEKQKASFTVAAGLALRY